MAKNKQIDDAILLTYLKADIQSADNYFTDEIEPACLKRLQRFLSDPYYYKNLFPELSERSSLTMSDVADTIYWIIPALMKIFFSSSEVVSITGTTAEDNPEPMKELCNWQIQKKNNGFMRFYKWFMDALQLGHGIIKIRWERQEKEVEETIPMSADDFLDFDAEANDMEFIRAEEQPDESFAVTVKMMKIIEDYAAIENVPVSEFRWIPDTSEVKTLQFCRHRRLMTRSDIEKLVKQGIFEPVTEDEISGAIYSAEEDDELENYYKADNETQQSGAAGLDKSRTQYWVDECFGKYDMNENNISDDMIITLIGDKIVRREVNEIGRPHFAVVSPYPDQYQITGKTIDDLIGELQDAKVAIFRQILLNVANNNDRPAVVDEESVNPQDLAERKKYIRAKGLQGRKASDVISYAPEAPLASAAFPLLQVLDQIKENRTGVTKYNQGSDSKDLNKTKGGLLAIMGAANQRIEMIARMFAETGVVDLFELQVEFNQRYASKETVIRLTNGEQMIVRPDDLNGDFDYEIASGIGAGQQQQATENMMLLLSQIYPALEGLLKVKMPEEQILETAKTLVTQMGYKNTAKYIPTVEQVKELMQQQQQAMVAQAQAEQQGELAIIEAKAQADAKANLQKTISDVAIAATKQGDMKQNANN